jgi:hypothetical protein
VCSSDLFEGEIIMSTVALNSSPLSRNEAAPAGVKARTGWFASFIEAVKVAHVVQNTPARDHRDLIDAWRQKMLRGEA